MTLTVRFKKRNEEKVFGAQPIAIEGFIGRGEFQESFLAPIDYWTREDYESSWVKNLDRIQNGDNGIFVTEVSDPKTARLFTVWPVVWVARSALLTHKLILRESATILFHPDNLAKLVDFADIAESIANISTWRLSDDDISGAQVGPNACGASHP